MDKYGRLRCGELRDRVMSADSAAMLIRDGDTVAVSGFTPSGCPKAVPQALAEQVKSGRALKISLLSGASTGPEIDGELAPLGVIARRYPYITSERFRAAVNGGVSPSIAYADGHLGMMAQDVRYGCFGDTDVAVIEACAVTEEGHLVPTTALGCAQTYADMAKKVIVELNTAQPAELEGLHDVVRMQDPPERGPVPLANVRQRIGVPYIRCPKEKIAGIVISDCEEKPRGFSPPDAVSRAIAANIVRFLESEAAAGRLSAGDVPLQSGVGSVANAVLDGLAASAFRGLTFYSEVIQDGILALMDAGKADFASGTSLCFSKEGMAHFFGNFGRYRDRLVLRDSEISNSAEVIRRLGVIAMNTAIEADIYGNVNSSHIGGCRIYNGIGGSGDYARSSSVSIFMTASTAAGGRISSVVPMVSHVDHTEHDVDVIVTEQGLADLRGRSPKERAELIVENCAHPSYRPLLRRYFEEACSACGNAQTPHLMDRCFDFHLRFSRSGSMLE